MNHVMEQTDQLVEAIHNSNEYAQYQMLQKAIMKDEGAYGRLNEYRRRNFELQMNTQVDAMTESERLRNEYADILNRTDVKEYLAAEQRYVKMIRLVNQKLDSCFDIHIEFL